ncbi:MAG: c-type cytochrome biogenesis protein CcmF, partial [Gammaproteobacteria bacterium]|nr:c-type cytochrome biogenesis protein CcmF [Gammaproteobacteria bacterium]
GTALPFVVAGKTSILVVLGISLGAWSICAALYYLFRNVFRKEAKLSSFQRFKKIPSATYGMVVAHIGIGIFVFGVTFVGAFEQEKEVPMRIGEKVEMAGYEFGFNGVKNVQGPNYSSKQASLNVYKNDKLIATLLPEKRTYLVQESPMTEAGIDTGFLRDVYVALGEQIDNEAWGMRLYYKPFIQWIWLGAALMALGGLLAALDKRYRLKLKREKVAAVSANAKQAAAATS